MMKEADTDGDGFISLAEFIDLNTSRVDPAAAMEDLRHAFSIFDLDRNGSISAEELASVLQGIGEAATVAQCRKMIRGVDQDGDGVVSFEEFWIMMTRGRSALASPVVTRSETMRYFIYQFPPPPPSATAKDRVFNFAAGPANLPESVILKAQAELFNYRGSGMSIMEMSHRSKEFDAVIKKAESDLRLLLSIPDDYAVLFLQGGATTQFAALSLNLCTPDSPTDYIITGSWGDKAYREAQKYCKPTVVWSGKPEKYTKIPSFDSIEQNPDARFLHICSNETIHGVEFKNYPTPTNKDSLMVADMSSNFCSKPVDVSKFGLIYAGAQKNIGPSGVTIVIVRKDLLGNAQPITPVMLDYKIHADAVSLYNTPNCLGIYICGLVFEYLLAQGGLVEIEKKNAKKAGIVYDAVDESGGFYVCPVEKSVRSLMNIPFTLKKSDLEKKFIEEAANEGMVQLKGHRSVGGMRASVYNAMPMAGAEKLVAFMKDFQARHG